MAVFCLSEDIPFFVRGGCVLVVHGHPVCFVRGPVASDCGLFVPVVDALCSSSVVPFVLYMVVVFVLAVSDAFVSSTAVVFVSSTAPVVLFSRLVWFGYHVWFGHLISSHVFLVSGDIHSHITNNAVHVVICVLGLLFVL